MFIDKLIKAMKAGSNPSVVGLDPRPEFIPKHIIDSCQSPGLQESESTAMAYYEFNKQIIDAVHDLIPAIKPQLAFYEALGWPGIIAFDKTVQYAKSKGLLVIADGKRNDIGSSAEGYAEAFISRTAFDCDALTVNPYLGIDGIAPFIHACQNNDTGIFALVKTSNPSSGQLQDLILAEGDKLYERVAKLVHQWGESTIGEHGYSAVGAVVGATYPRDAAHLRALMPHAYFLVPGYGAQGGSAHDILPNFNNDGLGAIVNASRSIMLAYKSSRWNAQYSEREFAAAARAEAIRMRDDINGALSDKG